MNESESQKLDRACQDIAYIRKFIDDDRKQFAEHILTSQQFRDKVIALEEKVKSHGTEHVYYRWLFGIIITVGLALLVK